MSIFDKFKKKFETEKRKSAPSVKSDDTISQDDKVSKHEKKTKKTEPQFEIKDKSGLASRIIVRPLQTEKITDQMVLGQYTFEVDSKATKSEVRKAVLAIYKVKPAKIRMINVRGKKVRFGRVWSKRKNWKKAIVTLNPGDKIEVFEGV